DLHSDCMVFADKYRLGQVLTNLISNAIKYSPRADKVIIKSRRIKDWVEVSIEDFGIGIYPKDQEKVFEHFYQVKNKIRESSSGLGLGLFISAEIIKKHRGKFEVESTKGKGSIF